MSDEKTLKIYASKAEEYKALTETHNQDDPLLAAFIKAMPAGGCVLDLGCGPGTSAAGMAAAGLKVSAFDPVSEMVALAGQHAGVSARLGSFDDVTGTHVFDGVWANFSLLHAPRDDLPGHLMRISQALKPGGRFHIAVKTGAGAHRDSLGRLYTYYTETELTGLLAKAGLTVFDRTEGCDTGLSGEDAHWIALAAMPDLCAYTDGACSGNPGPGGWGVLLQATEGETILKERELQGGEAQTTNNRMELLAAINALESLSRASTITIVTDSNYVKNGITSWIHGWKKNGWKNAAKKPVANAELWQRLDDANSRHSVTWKWVKGHAGHPENERADALARAGMAPFKP